MPWNNNKIKVTRKVMHVDCGYCKRFESECKGKGFLKINYMPECTRCLPVDKKKPPRRYDNTNKQPIEKKRETAIKATKPKLYKTVKAMITAIRRSARQGNGHR
jgi:hypothetical protein